MKTPEGKRAAEQIKRLGGKCPECPSRYLDGYRAGLEEMRETIKRLLRNRETHFRKWQLYMGAWDADKEAWQVAAHCCGYLHGICSVDDCMEPALSGNKGFDDDK